MRLSIEVYVDFICPWCLIGKRQLAQALTQLRAERPEVQVDVRWRGVQLLPALPVQGEDFHDFYLRRLGSEQAMGLRQAQVRQAAASVGVALDFGNIPRMPNTADAHRLWQRACQLGSPAQLDELLEWLFACHFLHGGDLGDGATLLGLAEAAGFGSADLVSSLQGDGTPFHCDLPGGPAGGAQLRDGEGPDSQWGPAGGEAAGQPAPGAGCGGRGDGCAYLGASRAGA